MFGLFKTKPAPEVGSLWKMKPDGFPPRDTVFKVRGVGTRVVDVSIAGRVVAGQPTIDSPGAFFSIRSFHRQFIPA